MVLLFKITTDNIQSDNTSTSRPLTPQRPQTPQSPQIPQRPQTPIQQSLPSQPPTPTNHLPYLSPAAFTPLLHALLLDQNTGIAQVAQNVIQSLVERILEEPDVNPKEKELLEKETLEGVVLGIGRLDQEKVKREELYELEADCDDTSVGAVTGIEEEVELGRMTMMSLISSLAPIVGPERCIRLFVPELDKMMEEPVFYVRKEAALAIGSLANVLPLDIITSKLLPIYDHFSTDPIWHVRRSCCLVLPTLCSKLPDEMKSDRAVKGIEIFAGDVSRSVRSAAGEIIGELIATFQPDGKVPESLVQHFLSLGPVRESNLSNGVTSGTYNNNLGQRDPERPVICAFNFPAVVLTLGESSWDDLKDTYIPLTRDMQIKVRRSLACSLHEIAKVIGPTKTENDLLNVFTYYLDDIDEVKSGIIEHLAAFIECLPQSTRNNYLPSLNDVWDGVKNHWRLRDEITKQIPALCRLFDEQYVLNHILPLTIRAVKDEVASVRETAVASFPALFEVIRNDESCFHDMINRIMW
ncbi:armadillo-type protein [Gigaspora rosea]|uniref:Armadillo-type protein n=1 Tax=Gigaspora rosea TaxID=44941 RepID=A0A397VAV1_9GLOM|nr:armadillo-type protein [Gigaspora rosea]